MADNPPTANTNLLDFPDEILLRILSHLSADNALDLMQGVAATCHRLRNLSHDPSVWEDVGVELEGEIDASLRKHNIPDQGCYPLPHALKREFVLKEIEQHKRTFNVVGTKLHQGTRAMRLRVVRWWGNKELFKKELLPRPRFQHVAEKVLEERCPNLLALRLTGLAPRDLADYTLVSVCHLSYDISPGDYLNYNSVNPIPGWRYEESCQALGREGLLRVKMSRLRTLEVRAEICPHFWTHKDAMAGKFILSPITLRNIHSRKKEPGLGVQKIVLRGFVGIWLGWQFLVEEEDEERWQYHMSINNIHQNLTITSPETGQRWKMKKLPWITFHSCSPRNDALPV